MLRNLFRYNLRNFSSLSNTARVAPIITTPKNPIVVQAPETKITTLKSGIRIATETIPSETATVSFMFKIFKAF